MIESFKTTRILKRELNVCVKVKQNTSHLNSACTHTTQLFVNPHAPSLPSPPLPKRCEGKRWGWRRWRWRCNKKQWDHLTEEELPALRSSMPHGLHEWPLYWPMTLKMQHVDLSRAGQNHLARQLYIPHRDTEGTKNTRKGLFVVTKVLLFWPVFLRVGHWF